MSAVARLFELRRSEHQSTVAIIAELAVCLRDRSYLDAGYSSLWKFLVEGLRYSEASASRRAAAARVVARFPAALDKLRAHELSLCTLAQAAAFLDSCSDFAEFLDRLSGKPRREVERVIARARPVARKPRERVRPACVAPASNLFAAPAPEERRQIVTSLTLERYETFERARALVSRKKPGATIEDVLNELVDVYLRAKEPKVRAGATGQAKAAPGGSRRVAQSAPGRSSRTASNDARSDGSPKVSSVEPRARGSEHDGSVAASSRSRHIPAAVRDLVMRRDGERCSFVSPDGHRCGETHHLQIDHIVPFALGGTHAPHNLRVLCAAHNRHRARQTFGTSKVP